MDGVECQAAERDTLIFWVCACFRVYMCVHACMPACVRVCVFAQCGVPLTRGWEGTPPIGTVVAEASGMISNFLNSPMNLGLFNLR